VMDADVSFPARVAVVVVAVAFVAVVVVEWHPLSVPTKF